MTCFQKNHFDMLEVIVQQANKTGWNDGLIDHLVAKGESREKIELLFPRGTDDIFDCWLEKSLNDLKSSVQSMEDQPKSITAKIHLYVMTWLKHLLPYQSAFKSAIHILIMPQSIPTQLKYLQRTADEIWCLAGDTSTDWNYYSKRMILAAVIKTTSIYWCYADDDEGLSKTSAFLSDRLDNVIQLGKLKSTSMAMLEPAVASIRSGFKSVRDLGIYFGFNDSCSSVNATPPNETNTTQAASEKEPTEIEITVKKS